MWQTKLISLYCAVCDNSSIIEREMQRQSNNFRPQFTDEECITVYLWGISQRRFEQNAIYNYTKNHLSEWFPRLPFCSAAPSARATVFATEGFSQIIKTLILHSPVHRDRWRCLRPHNPRILRLRHPRQNRTRPARRRP